MLWQHPLLSQRIGLAAGHSQERVQPQALVIINVLVLQGRSENALAQHLLHRVVHPDGVALVVKTFRQLRRQAEVDIDLAQQERAGVGGEGAAGEIGLHAAGAQVIKEKRLTGSDHAASLWTRYGNASKIFIKSAG